jgi:tetratricopeptide (TPR) repeat protein
MPVHILCSVAWKMVILVANTASGRRLYVYVKVSMNLNALLASSTSAGLGNGSSASQTTAVASAASPLLVKAGQRIQSALDASTTQLSKFGLLKSALADGQVAAQALSQLPGTATPEAVTTALGTFFNKFNATMEAAAGAANSAASTTTSNSAKRVISEARSALRADPALGDAMKKLGLTLQSNGSLVQDAKKFATSLASDPAGVRLALASVGKKIDALNNRELATTGTVGAALTGLGQRNTALTAQQKALKAFEQTASA